MTAPFIRIPGMGYALGPPSDLELGVLNDDIPHCRCGCPVDHHADAPDLPCLDCTCEQHVEDET